MCRVSIDLENLENQEMSGSLTMDPKNQGRVIKFREKNESWGIFYITDSQTKCFTFL